MKAKIALVGNNLQMMCQFRLEIITVFVENGYDVTVIAPQDAAVTRLDGINVRFIPIAIQSRSINPLSDLALLWDLVKIYKREKFVHIYHYTTKIVLYGSIASRIASVGQTPIMTGLGYAFLQPSLLSAILLQLYKFAFRQTSEVWFLNEDDSNLFVQHKVIRSSQAFVLPSEGVDTAYYKSQSPLENQPFVFLYVGRILKDKGVVELCQAAQILRSQGVNAQIILIGKSNDSIKSAISTTQLTHWMQSGVIRYIDFQENLIPYYEQSTCVVLPSYREGVSRVLLEAASMARPIITTNVPGCRDLVEDGETGWLCAPGDAQSLAKAMLKALNTPLEQLTRMGQKNREYVLRKYDITKIVSIYLDKLSENLNNK